MKNNNQMNKKSNLKQTNINKIIVMCMDAKLNFDDNARFRQNELFSQEDKSQMDPVREREREREREKRGEIETNIIKST